MLNVKPNIHLVEEESKEDLNLKIIEDAKDRFVLEPGQSINLECGDHGDDGAFENFIHSEFGSWGDSYLYGTDDVSIEFEESHH